MSKKTALVLSGGGARGAYQVGVLKGLSELLKTEKIPPPFSILSGTSAGAINTAKLACTQQDFHFAVTGLVRLWSNIKTDQVFKTDLLSFNKFGLGSLFSSPKKFNALLDTSPLRKLILEHCDFKNIPENLKQNLFETIIITANNYSKNKAMSFIQTQQNKINFDWADSRRQAIITDLTVDHIMASSSIPFLFPPIPLNGESYGDGCVRNNTPCSPSLRMGAEKLFVIGVRTQKNGELSPSASAPEHQHEASMIRVINTLLNAVFLDSVEQDVQRIQRINQLFDEAQASNPTFQSKQLKKIPAICISPSHDIGEIARSRAHHVPRILRMSINAFGHLDEASEILSYLLFDAEFCQELIKMGYEDCLQQRSEILKFMKDET